MNDAEIPETPENIKDFSRTFSLLPMIWITIRDTACVRADQGVGVFPQSVGHHVHCLQQHFQCGGRYAQLAKLVSMWRTTHPACGNNYHFYLRCVTDTICNRYFYLLQLIAASVTYQGMCNRCNRWVTDNISSICYISFYEIITYSVYKLIKIRIYSRFFVIFISVLYYVTDVTDNIYKIINKIKKRKKSIIQYFI